LYYVVLRLNMYFFLNMYFLESGALDRSAILTASDLAKFLCITDVGFKLFYLIQEFLALGCLYQDNNCIMLY